MRFTAVVLAAALAACSNTAWEGKRSQGEITLLTDMANPPIAADAVIHDLGGAFGWAEGPVWVEAIDALLMTDVPGKTIWRYDAETGLSVWMSPSTRPGADVPDDAEGANGLFMLDGQTMLVPDHGSRSLYTIGVETRDVTLLADSFDGRRLNSPNDVVVHDNSTIYFTDPPYGLSGDDDPRKEIAFNGVYALTPSGELTLVDGGLTRPNGIALSPDQSTLFVANSDPEASLYQIYPVSADGAVGEGRLLADVTEDYASAGYGLPDGMAISRDGTIFATGPGGVLVMAADGERLAKVSVGKPCANVTFGPFGSDDHTALYMTCQDRLYVVETNRTGLR